MKSLPQREAGRRKIDANHFDFAPPSLAVPSSRTTAVI
jgi:hypothetical protein